MTDEQPKDDTTIPGDTPTNRLHMMHMSIEQIKDWIGRIQKRRAAVVEKIATAKSNGKIARSLTVDKQFKKLHDKLEKALAGVEDDLSDAIDNLNKMRALYLEASDGQVIITKSEIEELKNGTT
jgi:hypothetical protein